MTKLILILALSLCAIAQTQARGLYSLNDDWHIFYQNDHSSDKASHICLPHTWNTDALTSQECRQTMAKYLRTLDIPAEWRGKRLFLRFDGVQSVADIFLNGTHVGAHHGGYTRFTVEITDAVLFGASNSLLVAVSNCLRNDLQPISVEQNIYGGIYRDVELIVTEPTTISPTCYGTDGIFVHQHEVSAERVTGTVQVMLSGKKDATCALTMSIAAPDGYVTLEKSIKAKLDGRMLSIPFTIDNPELWSPARPAMYSVRVAVGEEEVTVQTGFRKVEVTTDRKIAINGKRAYIHGVLLHHDNAQRGSALTTADYDADIATIREMGANAIRSVTGPHAPYLYDVCDRSGLLVWIDSPFVRAPFMGDVAYYSTPQFERSGEEQLREIIMQNINHPSVIMWGIFSQMRGAAKPLLNYIKQLNTTAKQCDASRPTVACSNSDGAINFITDLIVWQQNVGWSKGSTDDLTVWQSALRSNWSHLTQAVCYGESGVRKACDEGYDKADFADQHRIPEAEQCRFHEEYIGRLDEQLFWGIWLNTLFDFGSVRHTSGIRTTGLVEFDHHQRKDSYYLYRALWNQKSPTLHLCNKGDNLRSKAEQQLTIYSSGEKPLLRINGDTVEVEQLGAALYRSKSHTLQTGDNEVVVTAGSQRDNQTITIGGFVEKHR